MWKGRVSGVRIYPFAMHEWERRVMYRAYGMNAEGEWITGMPDLSGSHNDADYPLLPLWFRAWLWLRTAWAKRGR